MYHQFKELAGVDITAEAMEVGPTCHYIMGGVRVEADSAATTVRRAVRGRRSGRRHARGQPAGGQLPLRPVGLRPPGRSGAAEFAAGRTGAVDIDEGQISSAIDAAVAPFEYEGGENPYDIHHDLQETMQTLVGIIRTGPELEEAMGKLEELEERAKRVSVSGGRRYNPGWNLTTDLPAMLSVSRSDHTGGDQPQGEPGRAHP